MMVFVVDFDVLFFIKRSNVAFGSFGILFVIVFIFVGFNINGGKFGLGVNW